MRILITSGNFAPEKTGIGKYTGEMAAWLAERGHQVEVITGFPYYPEWRLDARYPRVSYRTEQDGKVCVHRVPHYIPSDGVVNTKRRMLVDLTMFISSLVPWVKLACDRKRRPDVIIAVCPPLFSGIWPWLFSTLFRRPWVYHIQDFQVDAAVQLGMIKQGWIGRLLFGLENGLLRAATRVSSITRAMCNRAVAKGVSAQNVVLLPNWSDTSNIYPSDRLTPFRKELGLREDQFVIMYAGAMGRKQGLELVLDAARSLLDEPRFAFVMIGSGSDAEQLKAEAEGRGLVNMRFLPLQPKERFNEVLATGDLHLVVQKGNAADLVMPSKLTNILAAGRASLVTATPGTQLWEATQGAGTGLAVVPEDEPAFSAAVQALAGNPAKLRSMGEKARAYAEDNLMLDRILERFEAQLQEWTTPQPQSGRAAGRPL